LYCRWAKKDTVQFTGGRFISFIAGGVSYSETRVGYELMQQHSKEVIVGSTNVITPESYLVDVGSLIE
jgi:syntaxin-binding protein 1